MPAYKCRKCGRIIIAKSPVKLCTECRTAPKTKTVESPSNKMVDTSELKQK